MSEEYQDPSANTQAFQAWVDQQAAAPPPVERSRTPLFVGVAVLAVVVIALVIFLAVR
jgi:hypothetical protein